MSSSLAKLGFPALTALVETQRAPVQRSCSSHFPTHTAALTSILIMISILQVAELAKQVPTYHAFIPVENGRDLVMIKRKLETDQYDSIEALEADFDLMIRNCYTFNGTESQISFSARELSDKFKLGIKRIKAGKSFSRRALNLRLTTRLLVPHRFAEADETRQLLCPGRRRDEETAHLIPAPICTSRILPFPTTSTAVKYRNHPVVVTCNFGKLQAAPRINA